MVKIIELPEVEKEIYWICMEPKTVHEIAIELKRFSISHIRDLCNMLIARKLMDRITTVTRKTLYHSIEQRNENGEVSQLQQ